MKEFEELYAVSEKGALRFFFDGIAELLIGLRLHQQVKDAEILHTASVLASFSLSPVSSDPLAAPVGSLAEYFDVFVLGGEFSDPRIHEAAGAQIIFWVGFLRSQTKKTRHNISWYEKYGEASYRRVSSLSPDGSRRKKLFFELSKNYSLWLQVCQRLNRELQESRFVIPKS